MTKALKRVNAWLSVPGSPVVLALDDLRAVLALAKEAKTSGYVAHLEERLATATTVFETQRAEIRELKRRVRLARA